MPTHNTPSAPVSDRDCTSGFLWATSTARETAATKVLERETASGSAMEKARVLEKGRQWAAAKDKVMEKALGTASEKASVLDTVHRWGSAKGTAMEKACAEINHKKK